VAATDEGYATGGAFDHHFASHRMGKIMPDEEVFQHVTRTLHCAPAEILFLDDNQWNVQAAKRMGLKAVQVKRGGSGRASSGRGWSVRELTASLRAANRMRGRFNR
jgi:FMN phosphatase YigB (HAD superfamily)